MIFRTAAAADSTAQQTGNTAVKQTQRRTGNAKAQACPGYALIGKIVSFHFHMHILLFHTLAGLSCT
jgi:hypothetical protein